MPLPLLEEFAPKPDVLFVLAPNPPKPDPEVAVFEPKRPALVVAVLVPKPPNPLEALFELPPKPRQQKVLAT